MPSVVDLIGNRVISQAGENVLTSTFTGEGKIVGLYFAARWHDPSVAFTPLLVEFYSRIRTTAKGKGFEIVFLSSDRDEDNFKEFLKEMPWHAVPFASVDVVEKMVKKYRICEMPSLVVVEGSTGKLIVGNGRECLSEDLEGNEFPWYQKPFTDVINGNLISHENTELNAEEVLLGQVKGIYFSAHWCPPCRMFTPQLAAVYEKLRSTGKKFEIIFISSDRSEASFDDYYKSMPWLALPYKDARIRQLTKRFEIKGIPALVLLDENNELISANGRYSVSSDPEGKNFPWFPQPVEELSDSNAHILNESACLILFTDGDPEIIGKAKELLNETACQYTNEQKISLNSTNELPELRFFYEGTQSDEIADSIRTFTQLDGRKPLLAILDICERRTYTIEDITKESIKDLLQKFKSCSLDYVSLTD